jgi:hypothetical protein
MNDEQRRRKLAGAAGAVILLLGGTAARADSQDTDWLAIAYIWGSGISIDARNASVDIDFDDLVDDLEMTFMGHVEAQGDDIGGFVDVLFVGTGANESRTNFDLNTDNDTTAMDLAMVWSPGAERMTGFELYGGLRYVDNDFRLVADPVAPALPTLTTGSDSSYYDVLFGARFIAPLSERWRLTLSGDLSVGDTEGTFSVGAYAGYRMGQHHFIGGYKHLEMDLESGSGRALQVTMTGPVIAYGYRF